MTKVINLPPERRNGPKPVTGIDQAFGESYSVENFEIPTVSIGHVSRPVDPHCKIFKFDHASQMEIKPGFEFDIESIRTQGYSALNRLWARLADMVREEIQTQHGVSRSIMTDAWMLENVSYLIKHADGKRPDILGFRGVPVMAFIEPRFITVPGGRDGSSKASLKARALLPNGEFK